MNNLFNIKIISSLLCIALLFPACQKGFFDQVPDDRITIEEVFNRRNESERFLANVYSRIRDESNQWSSNPWIGVADEADMTWARNDHGTYFINLGAWDANSGYFQFWNHYYQGIRSASYFMEHIGNNEEILRLSNGQQLIDRYRAEARFLRAYFYFCLLRQYGPLVILGNEVFAPDKPFSELQLPRNTFDECVDYIVGELDATMAQLPVEHANLAQDYGRATSVMCMAVKSRLLLYAASPLYNGNTAYAEFIDSDGVTLINQQRDVGKWTKAAEAAKNIIDLSGFELYKVYDGNGNIDALRSYRDILLEPWNKEHLFVRPQWNVSEWEQHCSPRFANGWSGIAVTQKQIDAYFMNNGKAIHEQGSGYVENGFSAEATSYTTAGTYNMYVNREPRFYASVNYNGAFWINKSEGERVIEMHKTGNSGIDGSWDFSRTGYTIRKNIHPNSNPKIGQYVRRPQVLFRLGEIYLNYAEALNESSPGHDDILKYVNLIRERAGIPGLPSGLSQTEMRTRIQAERRVELAFERHRYFDTRRWLIAINTDGGAFEGMNVESGTHIHDTDYYKRTVFETRVFEFRNYLWPIPQSELDRDRKLVQNPGW